MLVFKGEMMDHSLLARKLDTAEPRIGLTCSFNDKSVQLIAI
jgi:hypothetical protein